MMSDTAPVPPANGDTLQVFVVGSTRSGTSITYKLLRTVFGLPGRGESHVMSNIAEMLGQFSQRRSSVPERTLLASFEPQLIKAALRDTVTNFYSGHYPRGSWVDKTPGAPAIRSIGLIREWFPSAKIIVTMRTGVEVVASAQLKFGASFEQACKQWNMAAMETAAARAHNERTLFVEQFDMTNNTAALANRQVIRCDEYSASR